MDKAIDIVCEITQAKQNLINKNKEHTMNTWLGKYTCP